MQGMWLLIFNLWHKTEKKILGFKTTHTFAKRIEDKRNDNNNKNNNNKSNNINISINNNNDNNSNNNKTKSK